MEDLILPPIRPLLERCAGLTVHPDPYAGPFEAYHFLATGAQTWDVGPTLAVAAGRSGPVLDLGCGRGRLALALAAAGHDVTAVDTSAGSLAHLRAADPEHRIRIVEGDALRPGTLPAGAYGTVVVGDLSVNMFASEEALALLFSAVERLLGPGGVLTLPVLAADSPAGYVQLRGMTAMPFLGDDGVEQLLWMVMRFEADGPYFFRTLFVQDVPDSSGKLRGHVTAVRERLWTAGTIAPALRAAGLRVERSEPVRDDTAEMLTIGRSA